MNIEHSEEAVGIAEAMRVISMLVEREGGLTQDDMEYLKENVTSEVRSDVDFVCKVIDGTYEKEVNEALKRR